MDGPIERFIPYPYVAGKKYEFWNANPIKMNANITFTDAATKY